MKTILIPDVVSKAYNKVEVYLHNKRTYCWIIIKDKVYDVTPYVEEHPGGDAHAGDDSTEGFFGYPKDSEKIMLARQTSLAKSQIADWFINERLCTPLKTNG
ncbi:putative transcription factor Homeodomain-TALE-KNOX family [Helianthus annuus]|nr:putative transcription factor Homeodomain-TALE-KNOX family [Helianthus annuus]